MTVGYKVSSTKKARISNEVLANRNKIRKGSLLLIYSKEPMWLEQRVPPDSGIH
jgi:hypothetical protein